MKIPDRTDYLIFGGIFLLANKLQFVGDKMVEGLSTKQWFLLRTIMDLPCDPPPTISQIARDMDSTRQNITKMLEKMEREGIVTIEENESDHRSRRIRITESGLRQARQAAENAQGWKTPARQKWRYSSGTVLKALCKSCIISFTVWKCKGVLF